MKKHQNRCSATVAVLVENLQSSAAFEGSILTLAPWQQANSLTGFKAELAGVLHVAEGAAERLMVQAGALVRDLPSTLAAMECGELGWDFTVIIAEETCLLHAAEVAQEGIDAFEELLIAKARDARLNSFREIARRRRERAYPETIVPALVELTPTGPCASADPETVCRGSV
ncbi:hypothetical protein MB46_16050 [Arthrobacter alpinus]|uniref:DUF222 domain-containing protein n=1 Tax=Arthrobacter alpinus TaxID=656366 RepID=UPI0005C9359E|nr:DUF222 domain-containing protein [Arthrobacter alpinus]ALV46782.1 hypothetical protein MB46_16050 [Arthrobacter alpinus]